MTVALRPHSIFGPGDQLVQSMLEKGQEGRLKFTIGCARFVALPLVC